MAMPCTAALAALACCLLLASMPLAHGAGARSILYTSSQAVAADDAGAGLGRGSGTLPRRVLSDGPQSLSDNMNNLMHAFCRYQSGSDCDELDWTGNTDWYRKNFFRQLPSSQTTGLGAPNVPLSSQVLQNKTVSNLQCPYRNFSYVCRLDEQSFKQTVVTTTHSKGWNVGNSDKVTASFGVEFLGTGGSAGGLVSFSFSYSFQDATANAKTEQIISVESISVTMDPAQHKCLLLTTHLSSIKAKGTQDAYVAVSGWVGTRQSSAHHWRWDAHATEAHYYRAMTFGSVVRLAQEAGLTEASQWQVIDEFEARLVMPFDLDFDFGTSGYTVSTWATAEGPDCMRWDPGHRATVNAGTMVHNGLAGGADSVLPVIKAIPVVL